MNLRLLQCVAVLAAGSLGGVTGCDALQNSPFASIQSVLSSERTSSDDRKAGDVNYSLGQYAEGQGQAGQAIASYQEALRHDPANLDAALHLAALLDGQGKFVESAEVYRKAIAGHAGSARAGCNFGYSLYLQKRYDEAETVLRQALASEPSHAKSHTNLGLVLARSGRGNEALIEFRRGGCSEQDAHLNVAFGLTLEQAWDEARGHYRKVLEGNPACTEAKKGMLEIDTLTARLEQPAPVRENTSAVQLWTPVTSSP
jgi:tetratricopeptide (TPR) repeat protein